VKRIQIIGRAHSNLQTQTLGIFKEVFGDCLIKGLSYKYVYVYVVLQPNKTRDRFAYALQASLYKLGSLFDYRMGSTS